ncbi:MAG: hypothetical protein R6U61_06580 [Thermoplasmata archaeon]
MDRRILSVGVVILAIGLFLVVIFWPLTGVTGDELMEDKKDGDYQSYTEGDKVKIYGTITDVRETNIIIENWVTVEIDGDFTFVVPGEDSIDFEEGDTVYGELMLETLGSGENAWEYWELKGDLKSKQMMDLAFYGITGLGVAVTATGIVKF